jgi:guanylate kinase
MPGKLIIFSAPSGAGKTTLVKYLLDIGLPLEFSISATSRMARTGEIDGKDYYFLSTDDFKQKISNNEFIEWQEVYPGSFYGTLKSEIERIWKKGNHVIFDVDVLGGLNLKKLFPTASLSVFVMPPSVTELENRLRLRNTDSDEKIKQRVEKAIFEISFAEKFDKIIINDDLLRAKAEAYETIKNFISG